MKSEITNNTIKKGYFSYPISDLIKHLTKLNKKIGTTHCIRIECDPYTSEGFLTLYKGKSEKLDEDE